MDLKGGSTDWVYAHRQGAALDSDDQDISISQHDGHGEFQWELSQATGGSSTNPFLAASSDTTTSSSSTRASSQPRLVQAHGAVASIAFVAIFPIGAMLIRLVSFKGLVWIHAGLQIFGYVIFIAAAGIGIFVANKNDYLLEPHAVIGMLLLGLLFFMPVMGVVHHKLYNSVAMRTWWSYGHIFTGRIGIFLGMINGGLGLRLADADRSVTVAYGVLAGLVGATYFAAIVYGELQRMAQRTRSAALLMGTTKFENGR